MAKKLFIASTGQHKGKTTSTLGLVAAFRAKGLNVGYCKPVGQKHILVRGQMADKDTVLFEKILQFDVHPDIHSPVILASGVTTRFIQNPDQFDFENDILKAAAYLEKNHDIVVYEGTGHSGVGSIVNLSNAQVAKLLDVEVVMIVTGGIGSPFDRLNMNLSLFREQGVPIKGVIINKVHPDKFERVRDNFGKALEKIGIPLIGVLPYDKMLSFPLMGTIKNVIKGKILINEHKLANPVEEILAGSLLELDERTYFRNLLLITSQHDLQASINKIKQEAQQRGIQGVPLSGIIITRYGKDSDWQFETDFEDYAYLADNDIPVLTTKMDTYDTVITISRIEVKINTKTPWKVSRAIELIQENIDIDGLL